MKLDLNFTLYNGKTLLRQWWKVVKEHFEQVQDAVNQNDTAINSEVTARKNADTALQNNINAEAKTRETEDGNLKTQIEQEVTTRTEGMRGLSQQLSAESASRKSADNTLQRNIDAEASARQSADDTLQGNINAEVSARQGADNTLQGNINTEALSRQAADDSLQVNIDRLEGELEEKLRQRVVFQLPETNFEENTVYFVPLAYGDVKKVSSFNNEYSSIGTEGQLVFIDGPDVDYGSVWARDKLNYGFTDGIYRLTLHDNLTELVYGGVYKFVWKKDPYKPSGETNYQPGAIDIYAADVAYAAYICTDGKLREIGSHSGGGSVENQSGSIRSFDFGRLKNSVDGWSTKNVFADIRDEDINDIDIIRFITPDENADFDDTTSIQIDLGVNAENYMISVNFPQRDMKFTRGNHVYLAARTKSVNASPVAAVYTVFMVDGRLCGSDGGSIPDGGITADMFADGVMDELKDIVKVYARQAIDAEVAAGIEVPLIYTGDEEPDADTYLWFAPVDHVDDDDGELILNAVGYTDDENKMHVEMSDGKLYTAENTAVSFDGDTPVVIISK